MKSPPSLSLADHRLLDLVWSSEPISSPQLCKLAQAQLGWKRTTTYTVIKRLCDKGCLKNEAAVVTSLVDRATVQQADGQQIAAALEQTKTMNTWPQEGSIAELKDVIVVYLSEPTEKWYAVNVGA